jgi:uncharacterized protein YjbI with pentapeptide repeats
MPHPKHLAKLREGVKTWNAWRLRTPGILPDLKGSGLGGADLNGALLGGADLSGGDLVGATLTRADLSGATLTGADLSGADFGGANLKSAMLIRADLSGADLSKANLAGAHLNDANLIGTTLRKTDLTGASLVRADLSGADLNGANLTEADLSDAELSYCSLTMANLTKANLTGARLDYANLLGWRISGVSCAHIVRGDKREIVRFKPDEFEQKYRQNTQLFDIIIEVDFSELAYFVGLFIARSINAMLGAGIVQLKTLDAVSEDHTRFVFVTFDSHFFSQKKDLIQTAFRREINRLLATIEKPNLLLTTKAMKYTVKAFEEGDDEVSSRSPAGEPVTRKGERISTSYSAYLGNLEQAIRTIVFSTLRQPDPSLPRA